MQITQVSAQVSAQVSIQVNALFLAWVLATQGTRRRLERSAPPRPHPAGRGSIYFSRCWA